MSDPQTFAPPTEPPVIIRRYSGDLTYWVHTSGMYCTGDTAAPLLRALAGLDRDENVP
jgi:hypothetical protein